MGGLAIGIGSIFLGVLFIIVAVYLAATLMGFVFGLVGHVFRIAGAMVADTCRIVGSGVVVMCLVPMTVGSIMIGRWSASSHFGRAIQHELTSMGKSMYRVVIGHPVRLLGVGSLTEGIERRLPEIVAQTPGADKPSRRTGAFDGYTITSSLAGGGSGGKLYIAKPDVLKLASFERQGMKGVDRVVIKSFSLNDGSSLPQIVREGRALDAAKRLGLVLEHEMTNDRFHYVMRYVPGESLGVIGQRMHSLAGGRGLADDELRECVGYAIDLLGTLRMYHSGGLWHKDVKPDNVIVDGTHAHLVDFGLVTPLHSAMTLTTHGTEYFRDPELVRMALKGVKVSEVDGTKFDIYGVGAVLYQLIENSFPAHGGLSQISQRCPEALKWIIRRAMTDYDKRYSNVDEMYADLHAIRSADNPFAVKLVALPSMRQGGDKAVGGPSAGAAMPEVAHVEVPAAMEHAAHVSAAAQRGSPIPPKQGVRDNAEKGRIGRVKDRIQVTNWLKGSYVVTGEPGDRTERNAGAQPRRPHTYGHPLGLSAAEQIKSARQRASETRQRAHSRRHERRDVRAGVMFETMREARRQHRQRGIQGRHSYRQGSPRVGIAFAMLVFLGVCVAALGGIFMLSPHRAETSVSEHDTHSSQSVISFFSPTEARVTIEMPEVSEHRFSVGSAPDVPMFPRIGPFFEEAVGTVLVTWDDRASWPVGVIGVIDGALDRLGDLGFEVVGRGNDEKTTLMLGQLRKTLGTRTWGSSGAREALNEWLHDHDEFDAIIWFDRGDSTRFVPRVWAVADEDMERDAFEEMMIEAFGL